MTPLLSTTQIEEGIERMAEFVRARAQRPPLVVVGVLTGSIVMLADLIRRLEIPVHLALIQASSYRGTNTQRGELRINDTLLPNVRGAHVVVVDDIFDTGHTLVEVMRQLELREPASLSSAVLLRKTDRNEVSLQPDFAAFDIPDEFVVGYGLDYNDLYRNLPYVAVLEPKDMA